MITFQVTGLIEAQQRITKIVNRLGQPQSGLEKATNKVADVFRHNYDSEGGMVGGWEGLAEQTASMRAWQGFDPEFPIMFRYGALRAVAVEFFMSAKGGSAMSAGDSYSDQTVSGSLRISGSTATLHLGGSYKVLNQLGHENARGGPTPARPFWFIDRRSVAAAGDGIRMWIEDEVLAR